MNERTERAMGRLIEAFPSLADWWLKHRDSIKPIWSDILDRCDPEDVEQVVEGMIVGDVMLPANYEYDRIAILIRQQAGRLGAERRTKQRAHDVAPMLTQDDIADWRASLLRAGNRMTKIVRGIDRASQVGRQVRDRKITREEAANRVTEIIESMPAIPVEDQPRFRCVTCLDTGLIMIWDPAAVSAARVALATDNPNKKQATAKMAKVCMVACDDCPKGEHFTERNKYWHPLPTYHAMMHHRVRQQTPTEFARVATSFVTGELTDG